jgi:hypothetical protein
MSEVPDPMPEQDRRLSLEALAVAQARLDGDILAVDLLLGDSMHPRTVERTAETFVEILSEMPEWMRAPFLAAMRDEIVTNVIAGSES